MTQQIPYIDQLQIVKLYTKNLASSVDIEQITPYPRSTIKNVLRRHGVLRNRSEAAKVGFQQGRKDETMKNFLVVSALPENNKKGFKKASEKTCQYCGVDFQGTSPRQKWCTTCIPDKTARYRMEKYGISRPDWDRMLKEQGGVCAVCDEVKPEVVDHCHITGEVRGLLCQKCNLRLPVVEESGWLRRAKKYLGLF